MRLSSSLLVFAALSVAAVSSQDASRRFIERERLTFRLGTPDNESSLAPKLSGRHIVKRQARNDKNVVCYFTNWSAYRENEARFTVSMISPYICTHLIYAFVGIDLENSNIIPVDETMDIVNDGYKKFNDLKTLNEDLKTLVSLGGWNEGSQRFSPLAADPEKRKLFVNNTIKFLRDNGFDGIDVAWQYPAFREGGKPEDKQNYARLVQELREAFEAEAEATGRPRLLLSIVMFGLSEYIEKAFDVENLTRYSDFINLVAYNYHISTEPFTHHHAPLYPLLEDLTDPVNSQLNIDTSIKNLIAAGGRLEKLNLGVPTYGRLFQLDDPEEHSIGAPALGAGRGNTTVEAGFITYYELCKDIPNGWTVEYPNITAIGPIAYKNQFWVGYDDEVSSRKKGEYARMKGLGGIMFWTIDDDDFQGKCSNRSFGVIRAGREGLRGIGASRNVPTPTPSTTTTTTPSTTTTTPRTTTTTTPRRIPSPNPVQPLRGDPPSPRPTVVRPQPQPPTTTMTTGRPRPAFANQPPAPSRPQQNFTLPQPQSRFPPRMPPNFQNTQRVIPPQFQKPFYPGPYFQHSDAFHRNSDFGNSLTSIQHYSRAVPNNSLDFPLAEKGSFVSVNYPNNVYFQNVKVKIINHFHTDKNDTLESKKVIVKDDTS